MLSDAFGLVGTILKDQYRIDSVIGEGGFGIVYRGVHLSFEHSIAIKCLKVPAHFTSDAKRLFFEKFREEGKLLSKLSDHPSIVRVFDFGVAKTSSNVDIPYLILEWLDGQELGDILRARGKPFSEAEALELIRPVIEAIAMAHSLGIVHRDLKPANLILAQTPRGRLLKILDFGIAKAMQEGETATQLSTKTSSGFSAFSPQHGAPEQFMSKRFGPTGPWTDVHALGLILVELVTGYPALQGDEQSEFLLASIDSSRPTPKTRGAWVSEGFETICAKALSLRPTDRFADAGQMLVAIGQMQSGEIATPQSTIAAAPAAMPNSAPRPVAPSMTDPNAAYLPPIQTQKSKLPLILASAAVGCILLGGAIFAVRATHRTDSAGELQSLGTESAQATELTPSNGTSAPTILAPERESPTAVASIETPQRSATAIPLASGRPTASSSAGFSWLPIPDAGKADEQAGPERDQEKISENRIRRKIEHKIHTGHASIEEIRMLRAICAHQHDQDCVSRASQLLEQKKRENQAQ